MSHGSELATTPVPRYPYSDQPVQAQRVNPQTIATAIRQVVNQGRQSGLSDGQIANGLQEHCGDLFGPNGSCNIVTGQKLQDALQQQAVPWLPKTDSCPIDLDRFIAWLMRSSCSYNTFGKVASAPLITNTIDLPDPVFGYNISPFAQSLGVFFPNVWSGEGFYHGIYRVKISFEVRIQQSQFTAAEIINSLFESFTFRIIQLGSDDPFTVALNFGEPADARESVFVPSAGGYFLPEGGEFVPWVFQPDIQGYDLTGVAPGEDPTDQYSITARIRTYWREIV